MTDMTDMTSWHAGPLIILQMAMSPEKLNPAEKLNKIFGSAGPSDKWIHILVSLPGGESLGPRMWCPLLKLRTGPPEHRHGSRSRSSGGESLVID
jgi:hypothetical protein